MSIIEIKTQDFSSNLNFLLSRLLLLKLWLRLDWWLLLNLRLLVGW
jgi:hypothetical protein